MLSTKAVRILATTVAPKVVEKLFASEEFTDMLHETIPDLVVSELGELDEDLMIELSLAVMDCISLKACKL